MSTIQVADRFTSLPDEPSLVETVVPLEEHGFSVEVVQAREAASPGAEGFSVMTNTS